jgi:hypothetical protein
MQSALLSGPGPCRLMTVGSPTEPFSYNLATISQSVACTSVAIFDMDEDGDQVCACGSAPRPPHPVFVVCKGDSSRRVANVCL